MFPLQDIQDCSHFFLIWFCIECLLFIGTADFFCNSTRRNILALLCMEKQEVIIGHLLCIIRVFVSLHHSESDQKMTILKFKTLEQKTFEIDADPSMTV